MDILGQTSLLAGVISFVLGCSVLARNVRNKLFLSFAMVTTLISGWALSFFFEKIWPAMGFYQMHLFFNVLLSPACLILIRVMVRIHDQVSRKLFMISGIAAVFLCLAILTHLETYPLIREMVYFSPLFIVLQTLHLMHVDHSMRQGMERLPKMPTVGLGRKTFIYVGALFVLLTSVMDHVPWMGKVLPSLGNIGLIIYLFFLSQAITQQRLLNISALLSRSLVLLFLTLTLTLVYSSLVGWIEKGAGLFFLNSFIASFLILMLLDPLRTIAGYMIQRLMSPKHQRVHALIRDAQRKLTGIVDPGTLFQTLLTTVEQTIQPQWAALFVLRSDGTKFRRVRFVGHDLNGSRDQPGEQHSKRIPREVLANQPLLQYCADLAKRGRFPVLLDQLLENEMDRSASRSQRELYTRLLEELRAVGCNLLIPLFSAGKILGFAVVNVPSPPEPWGNNWGILPMIYPYFEEAAQQMQRMEIYARQRERERLAVLGEMAAGLAHEIRNPLGAIKGAAQFLDPSSDRPESRFLKIIIEEVDRLNRVVTQFLDYSKPPVEEFFPVDLSRLAAKTVESMRPGIRSGIELEFEPSKTVARVMAAGEQIQQVIINLIQNAINALDGKPTGMIRVSVSVEGAGSFWEVNLSVEDTGKGIKKENLEKLFIPFFTTSPGGTGLGLSISHKIVESHRGRIEVASEEGRFTRFSVILPLSKE